MEQPQMLDEQSPAELYGGDYHASLGEGTRRSAEAVVPALLELFRPQSVVDVGCGAGLWLSVFRAHGVVDVLRVDGPWVAAGEREIPQELFFEHDLRLSLRLERRFDLVLCLEVAEHLPQPCAGQLIESLTRLADIVVFSAAIPFQRGQGHVNEAWPSYWSALFAARGFRCFDVLRERFWADSSVEFWYRQNMLCFASKDRAEALTGAWQAAGVAPARPFDLVHPDQFRSHQRRIPVDQGAAMERCCSCRASHMGDLGSSGVS